MDARSRNDFIDTSYIIWVSNWDGPRAEPADHQL